MKTVLMMVAGLATGLAPAAWAQGPNPGLAADAYATHAKQNAELMQKYTQNYLHAGVQRSFSEYYTARYDYAILRPTLQRNIVFSQHNLVSDAPFNEFNVVLCRNVMIYFNRGLQERTHDLFHASLAMFGVLGLGSRESLRSMPHEQMYEPLIAGEKLYRRIV